MKIVNIHEAKTHLSRLVEAVVEGEPFVIAKSGRPLVKVIPLTSVVEEQPKRLGFLAGQIGIPGDFNSMS
jgi:prevent-host-death family protein